jgi:hypothetical protein
MDVRRRIKDHIASLPEAKRADLQELHRIVQGAMPACKLWFLDGKNGEGKTVSNPSIGYGELTLKNAGGNGREYYRVGISANTAGFSVYLLGLEDKTYLAKTFGKDIGKACVTGYCIRFKALKDIRIDVLEAAIRAACEAP